MFCKQKFKDICNQKFKGIDSPGFALAGLYRDTVEPTTQGGYGLGWNDAYDELIKRLQDKHPNGLVVNVEIMTSPGHAHPSYGCVKYTVTGDLYTPIRE
jgi:hypothetical protein